MPTATAPQASQREVLKRSRITMFGRDAPGFDELEIDWGPASPFGPNDDPGTPMTHQDSSESDELRPDLFEPGAAPPPAPEPVVTPAANAQPERPIAPFVRTLYALGRSDARHCLRTG